MSESLATILKKSGILRPGLGNSWACLIGTGNTYGAHLTKQASPLPLLLVVARTVCVNTVRLLRLFRSLFLMRPYSSFVLEFPVCITSKKTASISTIEAVHFSQANGAMVVIEAENITKIYFRAVKESKLRLSIQKEASKHSRIIPPVAIFEKNGLLLATFPRYRPVPVGKFESPAKLAKTIAELSDVLCKVEPSLSESLTIYNQISRWWEDVKIDIGQELKEKTIEVCMQYTSSLDRAKMPCRHLQHGDFWRGNILFTPEPVVIDFDSLLLGPKHYDLAYYVLSAILRSGGLTLPVLMATKPPSYSEVVLAECRRIVQIQKITSVEWLACENLFLLLKFSFCFSHNSLFSGQEVVLLEELSKRFDRFPDESSWVSFALGF